MKRKEKEKQRVCKTVLTFDRYSSKKVQTSLFLQWVLRNRYLEIMLAWEYKCSEESRWWIRFTDFFQGIVHVSRDVSVENILRGWRNFGNFEIFFPWDFVVRCEENYVHDDETKVIQSVNLIYIIYRGSPMIVILLFIEADYGH